MNNIDNIIEEFKKEFTQPSRMNLPLRSAKWERKGKDNWILIEKGIGFA